MTNQISVGDIVSGLDPNELVEIRELSAFGHKTLVEAVGLGTRREIRRPLTTDNEKWFCAVLQSLAKTRFHR